MLSKWAYAALAIVLLLSTAIAGSAAYRYREQLITARQQLEDLDTWAPGIIRAYSAKREGISPRVEAKNYSPRGSYLGYKPRPPIDSGRMRFDAEGLPKVKYGEAYHYNPVTMAQFALGAYGGEGGPTPQFLVAVEKLISMQSPDGAFLYDFAFPKYATGEMYEPGWASGMAQGQALSVFARAYEHTKDTRFLIAGNKALEFMMLPVESGGTATTLMDFPPEPSENIFIMEYPQDPPVYTLNGYMFSLLGLLDWADVTGDLSVRMVAEKAMNTLKIVLPYYDLGVTSAYDLSYITVPTLANGNRRSPHALSAYHVVHIELLWALHSLTGEPMLEEFADRWLSYVGSK